MAIFRVKTASRPALKLKSFGMTDNGSFTLGNDLKGVRHENSSGDR
jgi:hypothetical protein